MLSSKNILLLVTLLTIVSLFTIGSPQGTDAFSRKDVHLGDTGSDVREMQYRLKHLGFYTGDVNGVFNYRTYNALRNFQYEFGLKIDGILGDKTKLKLYNATRHYRPTAKDLGKGDTTPAKTVRSSGGYSSNDIRLMANAVHGEARGEPYIGKVAVAAVILNRTHSPSFPDTPAGVIFEPGAFTAVADGQIWLTPDEESKKAVRDAINGWDPTDGAIYYFNPDTATSGWIWSRPQVKRIGKHIFCR